MNKKVVVITKTGIKFEMCFKTLDLAIAYFNVIQDSATHITLINNNHVIYQF